MKMSANSQQAVERHAAAGRRAADHRRQRARRAADHDVLRRRALQPHRVDDDVEEDREGEQRRRQRDWRRPRASAPTAAHSVRPKPSASLRRDRARRHRRAAACAPCSASMSASHHMLSAPEAPAPTAMASSAAKPTTGLSEPGAISMPASAVSTTSDITRGFRSEKNSRGPARIFDDRRRGVLSDFRFAKLMNPGFSARREPAAFTRRGGANLSVLGAGDVRQRLVLVERRRRRQRPLQRVAPAPQGLSPATRFAGNAS